MTSLHVFFPDPLPADDRANLLPLLSDAIAVHEGPAAPDDYQVLVAGRPTREQLAASPALRDLVIPWAGLPTETRDLLREFPAVITHNLHHNAAPVAELAMMLLLAAAKFAVRYDRALRAGDWRPRYDRPGPAILLDGKTALVLGYGAIGRRVARACAAFGMGVVATRRSAVLPERDEWAEVHPSGSLPTLLPRANAVIICLPHTPETDGLLGAAELAALPPRSVLVNIGRGPIVEEKALYEALRDGHLAAAGLDVWYRYPPDEPSRAEWPPSTYPFGELDNVILSPHRGGASDETSRLRMAALADLLNAAATGQVMPNRVDLEAGY